MTTFPIAPPEPHADIFDKHEALGDPALTRIVDFFQAVVNAQTKEAWHFANPTQLPVETAFTHNPNKVVFNTRYLPAFFLYRLGDGEEERLSEDSILTHNVLRLLWVFPTAGQSERKRHSPFVNAVVKSLKWAIENGRHPDYVLAGDPDPLAVTQGSVIYRVADIFRMVWKGYKIDDVAIAFATGASRDRDGEQGRYEAMDARIDFVEEERRDATVFPLNRGLDLTVATSDKKRDLAVAKL